MSAEPAANAVSTERVRPADLGVAMAGATFAFLPMLIVFLAFQGYFVKGITMGAVKG